MPLYPELKKILERNLEGVKGLHANYSNEYPNRIGSFDTSYGIDTDIIDYNSVQLVMMSPLYGDSGTTVAYGQFSNLPTFSWSQKGIRA